MFKMDINRYVTELREQQEKIELGDVKTEIKFLEETLTKDLKATRDQNDGDFRIIKEAFLLFKEEVFQIINKIVKDNEFKIEELYNEIKIYEDEINKRFVQLSDRQDEYINTLKLIFETTTDKRTKQLVEQFLIDDEEVYLANKERFEKEFNERREAEKKSLEEKEREMLEIKLRTQQKIIDEAEKDNKELEQLEQEVKMRENQILSKKEEELINKYEEMQKEREDADYQNQIKLEENLFKYYSRREKENYRKLLKAQKKFMRTRPKEKEPESTERTKEKEKVDQVEEKEKEEIQSVSEKNESENEEEEEENDEKKSEKVSEKKSEKDSEKISDKKSEKISEKKSEKVSEKKSEKISEKKSEKPPSKKPSEKPPSERKSNKISSKKSSKNMPIENGDVSSLKQFSALYPQGEAQLKQFLKTSCKPSLISILKCRTLEDIIDYSKNKDILSETEKERDLLDVKQTVALCNAKIQEVLNNLIDGLTANKLGVKAKDYLIFVLKDTETHFVPFRLFSLFELSRLQTKDGYVQNISGPQKRMVISFYILLKLLIKNFFIDLNFVGDENKKKIDDESKVNFKIISSIVYYEVISMFKNSSIITNIGDINTFIHAQDKGEDELKGVLNILNDNFISGYPDTDKDGMEYLQNELYEKQSLEIYYDICKQSGFTLSELINNFIDKIIKELGV